MNDKDAAQLRVDQINAFQQELAILHEEDVLTLSHQQKQTINNYHQHLRQHLNADFDVDLNAKGKSLTHGMQVVSFIGALALAVSVFFLFFQYWGYFTTTAQVAVLIITPLLTLAATHWLHEYEQSGYFAKLAGLISFSCLVLNITMLGQIFNLTPTDNALMLWCVYALILAYAFDIRLLLATAILCFYAFVAARVGAWGGMYWLSMGERPENFILPALMVFAAPTLIPALAKSGFAVIYRVLGQCGLLLAILVLSFYGRGSYLDWDYDVIEGFYQVLGFVLSAIFIGIGVKKHWHGVLNTGTTFFVIFLYTKFFDWWWDWLPKYAFFFLIGISAVLILLIFKRLRALQNQMKAPSATHRGPSA